MPEITLLAIDTAAKHFAGDRANLARLVRDLDAQIQALKNAALPDLKHAVAAAAKSHGELSNLIDNGRHIFDNPRTIVLHGIKVGLRKGSGGIAWDDPDKVVALIERHLPRTQAELLIKTTKKPIAKALADLDLADLKRIGCRVEATGDTIVIKPADTDVDQLVDALLRDAAQPSTPNL